MTKKELATKKAVEKKTSGLAVKTAKTTRFGGVNMYFNKS